MYGLVAACCIEAALILWTASIHLTIVSITSAFVVESSEPLMPVSNLTLCSLCCYRACLQNETATPSSCKAHCSLSNTGDALCPGCVESRDTYNGTVDAVYLDSHRLQVRFEPKQRTVVAIEVLQNGKFELAGLAKAKRGWIMYRTADLCREYVLRLVFLTNDSTFLVANATKPGPLPELRLDTVTLDKLDYDNKTDLIMASLSWDHPFEYKETDISLYSGYVHVIECRLPEGFDPNPRPQKLPKGGSMTVVFPAKLADFNCKFLVQITAESTCGFKTTVPGNQMIELDCRHIQNFKCNLSGQKPVCTSLINLVPSVAVNGSFLLNVQWPVPDLGAPIYYHVRWGPITKRDLLPHYNAPRFSASHSHGHSSDETFVSHQTRRRKRFPEWKGQNQFGQFGPQPSQDSIFWHQAMSPKWDPHRRGPPPFMLGRQPPAIPPLQEDAVWMIPRQQDQQFQVDGNRTSASLNGVNLTTDYGVQVCAVFNGEYKHIKWHLERLSAFRCIAAAASSFASNASVCNLLDENGRSKALFGGSVIPDSAPLQPNQTVDAPIVLQPQRLRLPSIETAKPALEKSHTDTKPVSLLDLERMPANIGQVRNFSQQLAQAPDDNDTVSIAIQWQPPEGLSQEQVKCFQVTLNSLEADCSKKPVCCEFASDQPRYIPEPPNACHLDLNFTSEIAAAQCEFAAVILTTGINEAIGHTYATIRLFSEPVNNEHNKHGAVSDDAPLPRFRLKAHHAGDHSCGLKLNCSHHCNTTSCLCPGKMTLMPDGINCKLSEEAVVFSQPPEAKVAQKRYCVQYLRWQQLDSEIMLNHIKSSVPGSLKELVNVELSWNASLLESLQLDTIYLRWAPASSINDENYVNTIQIAKMTAPINSTSFPVNMSIFVIPKLPDSQGFGFQMCAVQAGSLGIDNWDVIPVNLLKPAPTSFGKLGPLTNEDEINNETIAIATVVPVCTLAILAAICWLLYYLHKERLKSYCSTVFARQQRLEPSAAPLPNCPTNQPASICTGQSSKAVANPEYQLVLATTPRTSSRLFEPPAISNGHAPTVIERPGKLGSSGAVLRTQQAVTFTRR